MSFWGAMGDLSQIAPLNFIALDDTEGAKIINTRKKKNNNHKANGVHKYLKQYLKMYNWRDREEVVNHYTNNWSVINDKPLVMNMKQRYNIIQENFDDFVSFLKKLTRKKKAI